MAPDSQEPGAFFLRHTGGAWTPLIAASLEREL
jgi:hypothetical protein